MSARSGLERVLAIAMLLVAAMLGACAGTGGGKPASQDAGAANVDIQNRSGSETEQRKRANIRMQLAINYYQDGKFNVALDELKQALTMDPNYADAHGVLALVYMELREMALAEQSFQRALQLEPSNSDLNNNYGWYLCQNGRERESLAYFETALKNPLYRQPAKPLQNAGVCAQKKGDMVAAENYFMRSFELDPTGTVAALNLAEIFYGRKDLTRARFYVGQINSTPAATAASLWLGIRIERRLGNRANQNGLETQLARQFPESREAQLEKRGAYGD